MISTTDAGRRVTLLNFPQVQLSTVPLAFLPQPRQPLFPVNLVVTPPWLIRLPRTCFE